MAYITKNWLKGKKYRNKFHTPESVRIFKPTRHLAESLRKIDDNEWRLDWGSKWEKQNNIAYKIGLCKKEEGSEQQNIFSCDSVYQTVYIEQDEIEALLRNMFLSNSIESNRDFLRSIVPHISDEFKFELVKLLLKDNLDTE